MVAGLKANCARSMDLKSEKLLVKEVMSNERYVIYTVSNFNIYI